MGTSAIALFVLGVLALILGAEGLVRGASRLAAAAGISPLVIGLTVVALGTGAPEIAVGVRSALLGQGDIAVGNVVGANILNVLLVLGLSAIVRPLLVSQHTVRLYVPLMIAASAVLYLLARDGSLGRGDGAVLFTAAVVYTVFVVREGRVEEQASCEGYPGGLCPTVGPGPARGWPANLALIGIGLVLLVTGADVVVDTAIALARALGVSELLISLTVVSMGTALPEMVTSAVASFRGETDIAVGNIVGSSTFNILAVLGIVGLLSPGGLAVPAEALRLDIPVMMAVFIACLPIFFAGGRIMRWEGALFLGYYAAYVTYRVLLSVQHAALPVFGAVMLRLVIPLTVVTLVALMLRAVQTARGANTGATSG